MKMMNTKAFEQWLQEQAQLMVRYRQVEKSEILAEYNTLKKVVESADFQAKKKELTTTRYEDTQESKKMARYKQLKWNSTVILYNLLKKEAWKEKAEVAEYLELAEQVKVPEFQQTNAFWKNKKRWFTTPESQQEKRYDALVKHADIVFYFQHTEQEIANLEAYKMAWAAEFETAPLSDVWQTGFLYPSKELKANHSHVNELQAYTQGRNTQVANRVLSIQTKKEKTTAPAWHPTKGMIMHPFAYTSDVWHTAEAVAPKAGVLQAKVRVSGKAKHVVCLTTAGAKKSLHILPTDKQVKYAIYTLVWNEKEAVNYVNDVEVARSKNPLAGEALHLLMRSYLPDNVKGTGKMEIDWIRIYQN
ncbi:MAG: hypothetical protein IJX60_00880 [Paludibacteraceae bacterium]|nr:hypothetical protein [Paludibacteraceae bacterium]